MILVEFLKNMTLEIPSRRHSIFTHFLELTDSRLQRKDYVAIFSLKKLIEKSHLLS